MIKTSCFEEQAANKRNPKLRIELGPDITTNLQEGPVGIDKGAQAWVTLKRLAGPPYGQTNDLVHPTGRTHE